MKFKYSQFSVTGEDKVYRPVVGVLLKTNKTYFSEHQTIALLGMTGFLDRFKIVFNGASKDFEVFVK